MCLTFEVVNVILIWQPSEQATMAELDDYLELLYDDLPAKIKGTGMILQLARTPEHLHDLARSGETLDIVCMYIHVYTCMVYTD